VESVESSDKVFEINTTDMNLISVVKSVIEIIDSSKKGKVLKNIFQGRSTG